MSELVYPTGNLGGPSERGLVEMAVRQRWPMTDEVRAQVVAEMQEILTSGTERDRIRAASVLEKIEKQNQVDELSAKHIPLAGEHGGARILAPGEVARLMDESIPGSLEVAE